MQCTKRCWSPSCTGQFISALAAAAETATFEHLLPPILELLGSPAPVDLRESIQDEGHTNRIARHLSHHKTISLASATVPKLKLGLM